jgi:hypothetical protein
MTKNYDKNLIEKVRGKVINKTLLIIGECAIVIINDANIIAQIKH